MFALTKSTKVTFRIELVFICGLDGFSGWPVFCRALTISLFVLTSKSLSKNDKPTIASLKYQPCVANLSSSFWTIFTSILLYSANSFNKF